MKPSKRATKKKVGVKLVGNDQISHEDSQKIWRVFFETITKARGRGGNAKLEG